MDARSRQDIKLLVEMSHRQRSLEKLKALDVTLTKEELNDLDEGFALGAITGDRDPAQMKHLSAK
ncbi:hypothetical protein [Granulicella sp. S156]|uniref:hypothetical protein n=1 Tax=Granulicella sp. S156 TaxID=1747224 RepID=UPI00131BE7AA|nr:hypothetical protein [Granulicella sp. S156]